MESPWPRDFAEELGLVWYLRKQVPESPYAPDDPHELVWSRFVRTPSWKRGMPSKHLVEQIFSELCNSPFIQQPSRAAT